MKSTPLGYYLFLLSVVFLSNCQEDTIIGPTEPTTCESTAIESDVLTDLAMDLTHLFTSSAPDAVDTGLDPLIEYLGNTPFVGLGEATHGTAEFYAMKDKIFRRLVEEKGFKAIIFEIPWGNALVVNDYVLNGIGELDAVVDQTYYWTYDTEEVRTLVEWMHNYNIGRPEGEKIHFVGNDPQGGNFSEEIQRVRQYLEAVTPDSSSLLRNYDQLPLSNLSAYASESAERHQANRTGTQAVVNYFEENAAGFTELTGASAYEVAYMAAHLIQQREYIYRTSGNGVPRDSLMAVYSEWWQRIFGAESKVAIWAHNNHVMDATSTGAEWMGTFLKRRWSEQYKNVGFSFGRGSFNAFLANRSGGFQGPVQRQIV
ncbi:MAG: erythromycin esterase family protein, partial [Bacteroidota bacterium]